LSLISQTLLLCRTSESFVSKLNIVTSAKNEIEQNTKLLSQIQDDSKYLNEDKYHGKVFDVIC
jgi:acetolactate synthase small subunit